MRRRNSPAAGTPSSLAGDWTTAVFTHDGGPVRTAEGVTLGDMAGPEAAAAADLLVLRIAAACGFASPVTFRQNVTAAFATTPTSYRRRFTP